MIHQLLFHMPLLATLDICVHHIWLYLFSLLQAVREETWEAFIADVLFLAKVITVVAFAETLHLPSLIHLQLHFPLALLYIYIYIYIYLFFSFILFSFFEFEMYHDIISFGNLDVYCTMEHAYDGFPTFSYCTLLIQIQVMCMFHALNPFFAARYLWLHLFLLLSFSVIF